MMSLTLEMESKVKDIVRQEGQVLGLFVLEGIPEKRLNGARRKYAQEMGSDETAIFLVDSTVMGSGKEGYLLTNKRFYYKPMMEKRVVMDVADITDISVTSTQKNKRIVLETIEVKTSRDALLLMQGSPEEIIRNEHIPLFYIFKRIVSLIQNPSVSAMQTVVCRNCGAQSSGTSCEYCSTPF